MSKAEKKQKVRFAFPEAIHGSDDTTGLATCLLATGFFEIPGTYPAFWQAGDLLSTIVQRPQEEDELFLDSVSHAKLKNNHTIQKFSEEDEIQMVDARVRVANFGGNLPWIGINRGKNYEYRSVVPSALRRHFMHCKPSFDGDDMTESGPAVVINHPGGMQTILYSSLRISVSSSRLAFETWFEQVWDPNTPSKVRYECWNQSCANGHVDITCHLDQSLKFFFPLSEFSDRIVDVVTFRRPYWYFPPLERKVSFHAFIGLQPEVDTQLSFDHTLYARLGVLVHYLLDENFRNSQRLKNYKVIIQRAVQTGEKNNHPLVYLSNRVTEEGSGALTDEEHHTVVEYVRNVWENQNRRIIKSYGKKKK